MQDIKVDEALWASSMLPEGIVERWFVADGATVAAGDRIAEIRIEGALHEITAPGGRPFDEGGGREFSRRARLSLGETDHRRNCIAGLRRLTGR
jgi:hypothetical protein